LTNVTLALEIATSWLANRDNTVVIFTSDNGPEAMWPWQGSSGPWRGYYFTHMEVSLRVPFIIRWPNRVPAGRVSDEIARSVDTYPTLAGFAGAAVPKVRPIDGVDQRAISNTWNAGPAMRIIADLSWPPGDLESS
jgi:arylsulfatase A-like enzyme